jgi:hypothetical protein
MRRCPPSHEEASSLLGMPLLLREGDKGERGGGGEKSVSVRGRGRSSRNI